MSGGHFFQTFRPIQIKNKGQLTQVLQDSYCPALVIVLAIELAPLVLFLVQDSGRRITTSCTRKEHNNLCSNAKFILLVKIDD